MIQISTLIFVACVIIPFSPWEDTHWPKWMMLHFVLAIYLGMRYAKKFNIALGMLTFTTIFSGAQVITNRETYQGMNQLLRIDMSNMSGKAVVAFLLLLMFLEFTSLTLLRNMIRSFIIICVFHCVYVLFQRYGLHIERDRATGFLPNVSMGPSMLAILYPLLFFQKIEYKAEVWIRKSALILFPLLIFIEGSSISWGAFVVGVCVIVAMTLGLFGGEREVFFYSGLVATFGLILGPYVDTAWTHPERVSRFTIWPKFLEWWWQNCSHLFGAGTGAFRHLGPNLQSIFNFEMGQWWYWAHNDWLQIIFEIGIVGFLSAFFLWIGCVKFCLKKYDAAHTASLIVLSIVAFGNYPLRLSEYCLLTSILIAIPIKEQCILKSGNI